MYADYTAAADILPAWKAGLLSGERPILYPVGSDGFRRLRIGPGLLTLLGGAPGGGKTCLSMQWVIDALRATPDLRALVVNVETAPAVLLDRQLSRLSGIDYGVIRDRRAADMPPERLDFGFAILDDLAGRLAFLNGPYTLEHAAAAAVEFRAGLVVVDYLQRVPPNSAGAGADLRQTVATSMQLLRQFTDAGRAVIVVSALSRSKGKTGSTYDGAGLASFRESSEVEFGCDDAYLLASGPNEAGAGVAVLQHLKARHGEPVSLPLLFDGAHQCFTALEADDPAAAGLNPDDLADAWDAPAGGGDE